MSLRHFACGAAAVAVAFGLLASPNVRAVAAALVNVTNTAANPVPTRHADELNGFGQRVFPNNGSISDRTIVVPAGKYLVITSVTGFAYSSSAQDVSMDVSVGGRNVEQKFPFHRPVSGPSYLENANTHVVADPGSTVSFYVDSAIYPDNGGYNVDVYGYYVSAN